MKNKKILILLVFIILILLTFIGIILYNNYSKTPQEYIQNINDNLIVNNIDNKKETKPIEWGEKQIIKQDERIFEKNTPEFNKFKYEDIYGMSSQNAIKAIYASFYKFDLPTDYEITLDYEFILGEKAQKNSFAPTPINVYRIYNREHKAYLELKEPIEIKSANINIAQLDDAIELEKNQLVWSLSGEEQAILRTNNSLITGDIASYKYITSSKDESGKYIEAHDALFFWSDPEGPFGITLGASIISLDNYEISSEDIEIFDRIMSTFRYEDSQLIDAYFID